MLFRSSGSDEPIEISQTYNPSKIIQYKKYGYALFEGGSKAFLKEYFNFLKRDEYTKIKNKLNPDSKSTTTINNNNKKDKRDEEDEEKKSNSLWMLISKALGFITKPFKWLGKTIGKGIWNGIKFLSASLLKGVKAVGKMIFKGVWGSMKWVGRTIVSGIGKSFKWVISTASSLFSSVFKKTFSAFGKIGSALVKSIKGLGLIFSRGITFILSRLVLFFKSLETTIMASGGGLKKFGKIAGGIALAGGLFYAFSQSGDDSSISDKGDISGSMTNFDPNSEG